MGIQAAAGFVAFMFGSSILDTALGNPPDRSHPAFWLFIGLIGPGMLVGFAGGWFGVVIPLFYFTGLRLGVGKSKSELSTLQRCRSWLQVFIDREEQSLGVASRPTYCCERCGKPATVHSVRVEQASAACENHYCPECTQKALWIPNPSPSSTAPLRGDPHEERRVELERLIFWDGGECQTIVLREIEGTRRMSLLIGYTEATSIWWIVKGVSCQRPLTHDVWLDTAKTLGAQLQEICVHDQKDGCWFADARFTRDGVQISVDIRPSDGLIVALKTGVPVRFTEKLLSAFGGVEPEPS